MNNLTLSGLGGQVLSQDTDFLFGFEAPVASGQFVVLGFEGNEAIFDGYEITVDLASDNSSINLHNLLDTPATLSIMNKYDEPRYINGVIAEIEKGQTGFSRTYYRAVIKPALHRLNYVSDSQIFQEMTVPDISTLILEAHRIPDVEWKLALDHQTREYCVQYGETAYDFLRRIWAEEGMFFWFEHSENAHMMVISDAPLAMPMLPLAPSLTYNNNSGGASKGSWVSRFNQVERLRATNRMSADYSFKRPAYHQQHQVAQYVQNGAKGQYELYQYPGRHKNPGAGQPFNDYALEAHRVEATTAEGETNNIQLSAGFIFGLTDHPDDAVNENHRLLSVYHTGSQPAALEEDAPEDAATTYAAKFTTQPSRIPYRPNNPNPKPMVEGPQIAHVTGPAGEEIYCDEHGRVKIWFPWDRHGQKNENSSCWVRVSQGWAGGTWGSMSIPRIDQEVIVDFLEGDPDQPIITGRTYHATNKPPYVLPEHKTKMVIRSDSHKSSGYNELSFEDEGGKENVSLYAQKDQTLKVQHNRMKRVDHDQVESVGSNKSIDVGNNHVEKIGGSMMMNVGGGGGSRLFAGLAGLSGGALKQAMSAVEAVGNPLLTTLASGLVPVGTIADFTTGGKNKSFSAAGQNRTIAGADQAEKGTKTGGNVGKSIPISGVYIKTIEKAESSTIGIAKTEQVGIFKNTMVGHTQTTFVGKHQKINVGDERSLNVGKTEAIKIGEHYSLNVGDTLSIIVGKSSISMTKEGNITISGVKILFEGQNNVKIDSELIDLN